jgi:flagellar secretion chaperone FliS
MSMNAGVSYREAAAAGASPVQLVILLYEQIVEDLRRALSSNAKSDIEGRTHALNHALIVIGHLQATLDKEHGGKVAETLERFYEHLRGGLVEAQCKQSGELLEQHISSLMQVHQAWCEVERATTPTARSGKQDDQPSSGDWRA